MDLTNSHYSRNNYSGERSRRNSFSDDSEMTDENVGGSRDNLHLLGHNPDKECEADDVYHISYFTNNLCQDNYWNNSSVNNCLQNDKQILADAPPVASFNPEYNAKKKSFAHPSNTTTWEKQQHQRKHHQTPIQEKQTNEVETITSPQLLHIRLKLEEKRRQIKSENRRKEAKVNKQRQKLGKVAFLQAVSKDMGDETQKWQNQNDFSSSHISQIEELLSPDSVSVGIDQCQNSISQVTDNKILPQALFSLSTCPSKFIMNENSVTPMVVKNDGQTHPSLTSVTTMPAPSKLSSFLLSSVVSSNISAANQTLKHTNNNNKSSIACPSADDMAPQSISFIGSPEEQNELLESFDKLQINRTYRIPSSTRSHNTISHNSFSQLNNNTANNMAEKGFYISFDDHTQPKRPKPPLRRKKTLSNKGQQGLHDLDIQFVGTRNEDSEIVSSKSGTSTNESCSIGEDICDHSELINDCCYPTVTSIVNNNNNQITAGIGLLIDVNTTDNSVADEMERKKENILLRSLQRRQKQEEMKAKKEIEAEKRKEKEKLKEETAKMKKKEEKKRRAAILEQHRFKKAIEAEREGKSVDKEILNSMRVNNHNINSNSVSGTIRLRDKQQRLPRSRPKTIHISSSGSSNSSSVNIYDMPDEGRLTSTCARKRSSSNMSPAVSNYTLRRDYYRGSQDCLLAETRASASSIYSDGAGDNCTNSPVHSIRRQSSYRTLRGPSVDQDSLLYRNGDRDTSFGRVTPPHRTRSPSTSPSGPGSLPARRRFDDAASENGGSDYSGPRLYKQPTAKSNRSIILNAVEYCVFPGVVNREAKNRVLEEMNRSDANHFLILFRDAGCQFRALYSYFPGNDEIIKLYGTGPKQINDRMFDKFFKYNSGGKCFFQVHTKHLTVTIDAFTIHNSLWQGKKVNLPNKRDMTLVI